MFAHEASGKIVATHAPFAGIGIYGHAIVSAAIDYAKYRINRAEGTGFEMSRSDRNGTYLSLQLSLYQSSYGLIVGESFRECLGDYAACGLLRENIHRLSGLEILLIFIFWICCEKTCFRANDRKLWFSVF
jgi:hypothetical protein